MGVTVTVLPDNNPFKYGDKEVLRCTFDGLNIHRLTTLSWTKGDNFPNSTQIAYYTGKVFHNDSYGKPGDYVMTPPDSLTGSGSSNLIIKKVIVDDIGKYWCSVSAGFIQGLNSFDVDLIGKMILLYV